MSLFRFPRTADPRKGDGKPYLPAKVKWLKGYGPPAHGKVLPNARKLLRFLDDAAVLKGRQEAKARYSVLMAAADRRRALIRDLGLEVPSDSETVRKLVKALEVRA